MKVSVIVSTYNRSDKLKRAIDSVLSQTFKDFELIIVDDGSTDNTRKVVLSYTDDRIHYLKLIQNHGSDPHPKNQGILYAKHDHIAFLDDDNEFTTDHLMILVKEAERHPEADVIYGDRMIVSDDEPMDPQVGIAADFNPSYLMERNFIDTGDVLVKKEALYLVGGWDERYQKYVDWNLWIRIMKSGGTFWRVPKVISIYHLHKKMKSVTIKDHKPLEKPFGTIEPKRLFMPQWDGFELEIQLPFLGDIPKPKVAVFTLTKDRLDYTKRMYEGLLKADYDITWVVVDQGSKDGTVQWLKSLKPKGGITPHCIFNKENHGISGGSNQALNFIGDTYDFIIKIDNDCEINANAWLLKLIYIFQAHWQLVLSPYVEGLVDNPGGAPRLAYKTFRGHMIGMTRHIGGIFVMAHKSAYKEFRWDSDDFLHSMQDVMFSKEMEKRGYLLGYVEDMKVMHMDTTDGQKAKYPEYFEKRRHERTHVFK